MGGFSDPIVGGQTLIRRAIKSPDYIAGVSGWSINRDGTAEFSNALVRGDFATGVAGGGSAYVTLDDTVDRSTISFWNAAGTNRAYINAPLSGSVPGLGMNTGTYSLSGTTSYSRLFLRGDGSTQLTTVRASDQTPLGGEFYTDSARAQIRYSPLGGAATGGFVGTFSNGANIEYQSAGSGLHGIKAGSTGVTSYGTFLSNIGWSAVPGASVDISEFRMDRWGPFVSVHVFFTVTAAIAAGNIADQTIATITSAGNLPLSQTSCACQWSAGVAAVSLDSAGVMLIRWLSTALGVGDAFRVDTCYFNGG